MNKTCLERFGAKNVYASEYFFKLQEKRGARNDREHVSKYKKYCSKVRQETRKNRKKLFDEWDGKDFYTNEELITNEEFKKLFPGKHVNHKLQPTIDHKISILYGFLNKIDYKIISSKENLCICSRSVNASKMHKIDNLRGKYFKDPKLFKSLARRNAEKREE